MVMMIMISSTSITSNSGVVLISPMGWLETMAIDMRALLVM